MKRYCILALALILALSLFACSTQTGPVSEAEPAAPGEAASETEAPEEPAGTEAPVPKDLEPADVAGVWKCGSEGKKLYARLTFTDGGGTTRQADIFIRSK